MQLMNPGTKNHVQNCKASFVVKIATLYQFRKCIIYIRIALQLKAVLLNHKRKIRMCTYLRGNAFDGSVVWIV